MANYEVEVEVHGREVYQIEADSEEEARENFLEYGTCVISETLSVEDIVSVRLDDY